jgi:hypothetical protein
MPSDKHSPQVDDALKNPRVAAPTGYKHEGAPNDDDVFARPRTASARPGTPPGVEAAEIDLRAELASFIDPSAFPGDRESLLASARDNDAPSRVMAELRALPSEGAFATVQEVWETLGGHREHRGV